MLGINTWIGLNLYTNNVLELTRNAGSSTPDRYTAVLHSPSLVIRRHETIQKKGIEVINSADSPIEMSIEYALEQFESHG